MKLSANTTSRIVSVRLRPATRGNASLAGAAPDVSDGGANGCPDRAVVIADDDEFIERGFYPAAAEPGLF